MSEEQNEEEKKGAAGGSFEGGLRSSLEKAPGLAAPSWATMQSAMAGGAAGSAAAASWRWIIGPAAGAALLGGAMWFSQPSETTAVEEASAIAETEQIIHEDAEVLHEEGEVLASEMEGDLQTLGDNPKESSSERSPATELEGPDLRSDNSPAAVEVKRVAEEAVEPEVLEEIPSDWASLPADKAAAFGADISASCVGAEIGFRMGNPMKDIRVLWNFGDGQFSSKAAPHHTFMAPGTYDITLSVTRISDGLIRTRTIENMVTIHPIPEAEFTWEVPATAEDLPVVAIRDRSREATSTTWIVDGETTLEGESVSMELAKVGEHVVQLVASSPHGCQSVAQHSIEIGNRFGLGGSARFSPNGDGRYDTFLPRKLMREDSPFVFRVEDGEGRIVHETSIPKAWDGLLPNGQMARPGEAFNWTAVIQGKSGPSYFSDALVIE